MEHPMEDGGLMSYLVLARKWRPKRFAELVGQEHVVRALSNALDSGRVHHAFLFTGTRGVGKTTIARIFAKSLNCEQGTSADPCGQCAACLDIDAGRYIDLLEIDAASNTGVDDVREVIEATCTKHGLSHELVPTADFPALYFDKGCVDAVRESAKALGLPHMDIVSGAGHDAIFLAELGPAGMIFVPCENGISHNEIENATPQDLAAGARVLVEVLADGARLGLDPAWSWSCYDPSPDNKACGQCDACRLRAKGFADAGLPDEPHPRARGDARPRGRRHCHAIHARHARSGDGAVQGLCPGAQC